MNRVLVDNGASVNLLLKSSLKKLGKRNPRLIPTSTTIANFAGDKQMAQGILPINLSVGTRDCMTVFFVKDKAKLYTEGVTPLSILRKPDGTAKKTAGEEVAHLKHVVQESTDEKFVTKDDNDACPEGSGTREESHGDFVYEEEEKDVEPEKMRAEQSKEVALKAEEDEGEALINAQSYNELSGLDRSLVEHRLPMKSNFKPRKQKPRRMSHEVVQKVKKEILRLLKVGFIRITRYVKWLFNIVSVVKKNGKMRVCINFRNLNLATPKVEYPMPIVDLLVDSSEGHWILSMMDGHSDYN
ncbi:uncharacterized protein LOC114287396 [Camellia sinensis]|uniref:uncharacterized protein LOC114287396 n=1 Tax=Camellia sinensis TaxID=4442 RepID=UPI001035C711|nr:uncharacterized protein LOC114287396 [Camellia sinensis]